MNQYATDRNFVHFAVLNCPSCDGTGYVDGALCGFCVYREGDSLRTRRTFEVGCKGQAELVAGTLANCLSCGGVKREELSRPKEAS